LRGAEYYFNNGKALEVDRVGVGRIWRASEDLNELDVAGETFLQQKL
jgi:hypothetical protein